jgi:formyltetrahydrofolate-dependent phosphoribosylglycinamide formyltransferase
MIFPDFCNAKIIGSSKKHKVPAINTSMFQRLQQKWKVNGLQLVLILCTFAIGGSLTGFVGRRLMNFMAVERGWLWAIVYIIIITLIWPVSVLLVSLFFGQYRFFLGYLKKIGRRMGVVRQESKVKSQELKKIEQLEPGYQQLTINGTHATDDSRLTTNLAIFASGAGSNTQKIIDNFRGSNHIKISLIICNKPGAGVLNIAAKENIPAVLIDKEKFFRGNAYTDELREHTIDFIILAGFLWKIPAALIKAYRGKIVNIHPALLPKYGGKGMYGRHVHEAVINGKEKESGITIHYVDEHYDHGDAIFQARCAVLEDDTAELLAQRIHMLEHEHYPRVIENILAKSSKEKKEFKEYSSKPKSSKEKRR